MIGENNVKNIGLFISSMNGGGAERVVSHLSRILADDFNVHVILLEDTYNEYNCGGQMHNLDVPAKPGNIFVKLSLLFKRVKRMKELIKKEKLDCVISFLDSPNFVNLFAKVRGCKKIISIRNYSSLENNNSLLGKITKIAMKFLYKKADCVVTVSKLIERDFKEHYGIPANKIVTIYNPYDFSTMEELALEPLSDKESNFFNGNFVYCNVGRIMHQKGIWHLVKAFYKVQEKHPEARLVLVGEDFSEGKLQSLINAFKIEDKVLLTGRVKNPYKYMKHSSAYVLSSLFEGFPNAMVEAMACGLPVIAADCKSGPREILCKNPDLDSIADAIEICDYGILVPPLENEENWELDTVEQNVSRLSKAMEILIADPSKTLPLSSAAVSRSRTFGFEECRKGFLNVILD